jgi:hypothetical protein
MKQLLLLPIILLAGSLTAEAAVSFSVRVGPQPRYYPRRVYVAPPPPRYVVAPPAVYFAPPLAWGPSYVAPRGYYPGPRVKRHQREYRGYYQ